MNITNNNGGSKSKVSVIILTKNRKSQLANALASVRRQSFTDYEVMVVDDGSDDGTGEFLKSKISTPEYQKNLKIISHKSSLGITASRQEALTASTGEYVAILDDDDEWIDNSKLKKQAEFLDAHPEVVLVGGGIRINNAELRRQNAEWVRPRQDSTIRNSMLFKNPFFTSTVMFRRQAALQAGGFIKDTIDLGEDYDLWLRLGLLGKFYNFQEPFTLYCQTQYNKAKLKRFYQKQLLLVKKHSGSYPYGWLAKVILILRIAFI